MTSSAAFAVVLISANAEWQIVREVCRPNIQEVNQSPYGEWFQANPDGRAVIFVQGGWGKISASASAQYAIQRWSPRLVANLGTCGGFSGRIWRGDVILVERALVYDIIEQMGDPAAALRFYETALDLSWLREPLPLPVRRGLLVSADRDICVADIPILIDQYGADAADWESGAIAWVAKRNNTPCLILRGVSDLVGEAGGEAYNAIEVFHDGARRVMESLLASLPAWLACVDL